MPAGRVFVAVPAGVDRLFESLLRNSRYRFCGTGLLFSSGDLERILLRFSSNEGHGDRAGSDRGG